MSDSVRPHRQQPTRLPHPWDSPGKNNGVGCHFLLQCMKVKRESEVAQLCPTLRDPMDCSVPGSSVHGIFQARVLEWGAIAFSAPEGITSVQNQRSQAEVGGGPARSTVVTKEHRPPSHCHEVPGERSKIRERPRCAESKPMCRRARGQT